MWLVLGKNNLKMELQHLVEPVCDEVHFRKIPGVSYLEPKGIPGFYWPHDNSSIQLFSVFHL